MVLPLFMILVPAKSKTIPPGLRAFSMTVWHQTMYKMLVNSVSWQCHSA
jgi:hypothetical protein